MDDEVLARVDAFLDATVRDSTDRVDVGPMRVLLSRRPWPYYARPRAELDLSAPAAVTGEDVAAAAALLEQNGAPVAFEWVRERVPSMDAAVTAYGLAVEAAPLLVRRAEPLTAAPSPGVSVRLLAADDELVPAASQVVATAFGSPYVEEHDHIRSRIERGLNVTAVAQAADGSVVGVATLQPIDSTAEIVGVAVLPEHRRRGIGAALVRVLVTEASALGVGTVLLSAAPDALALYESLGFAVVGTLASAPPDPH
ncbi:GNAT family N-acetyltransferase [Longivirga aurantiaca]|uniref:GNAT family N-acetyltransferase n=1 Tax=Longivirga aurantiaca TaxID=1837743 RepID=A0ABW1SWB9_9ACTN